jgi:hypothetical protein
MRWSANGIDANSATKKRKVPARASIPPTRALRRSPACPLRVKASTPRKTHRWKTAYRVETGASASLVNG